MSEVAFNRLPAGAVGALAPDFEFRDSDGHRWSLRDLRGQPVLVAFFPEQWDPTHAQLRAVYDDLLAGTPAGGKVVSIGYSGLWCDVATSDGDDLHVAIADAGADASAARLFGIEGKQACFLVDGDGVVRWRHVSPLWTQPDFDELTSTLDLLSGSRGVSRREFLLTAFAISVAAAAFPRLGRAADAPPRARPAAVSEQSITLDINGRPVQLKVEPRVTLLDALRERIGFTGS